MIYMLSIWVKLYLLLMSPRRVILRYWVILMQRLRDVKLPADSTDMRYSAYSDFYPKRPQLQLAHQEAINMCSFKSDHGFGPLPVLRPMLGRFEH